MIIEDKEQVRNLIWSTLESNDIFKPANLEQLPKSPYGRIPDFLGSAEAAELLRNTGEWQSSKVIFSSPDTAQKKVREFALLDKKLLIMASPKLKDGFLLIDHYSVKGNEETVSTIKGAFKFGKKIHDFPSIDLVVEG